MNYANGGMSYHNADSSSGEEITYNVENTDINSLNDVVKLLDTVRQKVNETGEVFVS